LTNPLLHRADRPDTRESPSSSTPVAHVSAPTKEGTNVLRGGSHLCLTPVSGLEPEPPQVRIGQRQRRPLAPPPAPGHAKRLRNGDGPERGTPRHGHHQGRRRPGVR
jgi:hypothetical protein